MQCPICLEDLMELRTLGPCRHKLCAVCMKRIEVSTAPRQRPRCPFCRVAFVEWHQPKGLGTICLERLGMRLSSCARHQRDKMLQVPEDIRWAMLTRTRWKKQIYGDTLKVLLAPGKISSSSAMKQREAFVLDLSYASNLKEEDIGTFVDFFQHRPRPLLSLSIAHVEQLRDEALAPLFHLQLPNLETLRIESLDNFSGDVSFSGKSAFSNLRQLRIIRCRQIGVETLVRICSRTQLHELHLTGTINVEADTLCAVSESSPDLKVLRLGGCWRVSTEALVALLQRCKKIQDLELCQCTGVYGDTVLLAAAENLHQLKRLDLTRLPDVSDHGLVPLVASDVGASISELRLTGCEVTNSSLRALSKNCRRLECLDISSCPELTDNPVMDFAHGLGTLRHLNVNQCRGVSQQARFLIMMMLDSRIHTAPADEPDEASCGASATRPVQGTKQQRHRSLTGSASSSSTSAVASNGRASPSLQSSSSSSLRMAGSIIGQASGSASASAGSTTGSSTGSMRQTSTGFAHRRATLG